MNRTRLKTIGRRGRRFSAGDKEWRKYVCQAALGLCQRCGRKRDAMHCHHILGKQSHPHLRQVITNGVLLCPECHAWAHHDVKDAREFFLSKLDPYDFAQLNIDKNRAVV
jgi:5-methylcytosine-specific restriction endonuclease McrA